MVNWLFLSHKIAYFRRIVYICIMIPDKDAARQYLEARIAIRGATNPEAYLRLGMLYAKGIGTTENHTLANYFYEKALAMGCQEAEQFIDQEFESGNRNIMDILGQVMDGQLALPPEKLARYKKWVDKERIKKNYGFLSTIREYIPTIYPEYDKEKAYADILNGFDTVDADICYALCTSNNEYEVEVDQVGSLLHQLFAPVTDDGDLMKNIRAYDGSALLGDGESSVLQCIVNLQSSYSKTCKRYKIEKQKMAGVEANDLLPFFKVSLMTTLRRQAFRCLLSLKDLNPLMTEFLDNLDNDQKLLEICEEIRNQDLQLFVISYVELNIDLESIMQTYQALLQAYKHHQQDILANYLDDFYRRLNRAGFLHRSSPFTPDDLPPIELP